MKRTRAFTLVELLIVIGIIATLIAILLPVMSKAREQARCVTCQSNQRQILMAMRMYSDENRGWLPVTQMGGFAGDAGAYFAIWQTGIGQYDWEHGSLWSYVAKDPLSRRRVFNCPSDDADPRFSGNTDGTVDLTHIRNFSYNFSPDLATIQRATHRYGLLYSQVVHPEHKILVVEQENPRSTIGQINVIAAGPQGTGAHIGKLGVYPMLTARHSGSANAGMADGHVERIDSVIFTGSAEPPPQTGLTIKSSSYYHFVSLTDPR